MSKIVPLEGFGGGASSPLNFKIVAYATEEELVAAQPKENTIGVITTTPINGWVFDSEDPYEILISYQSQTCIVNSSVTYFDNILTLNSTPTTGKSYIININGIEHSIIITNSTSESSEDGYIDLVPSGDGYMVRVNDVIESPCTIEMYSKKPENGFIWIAIGTSSTIAFNALKKNGIQVYPISAKQYIGGELTNVEASIYRDGAWTVWSTLWDGTIFEPGNQHEDITGGWTANGYHRGSNTTYPTAAEITDDGIYVEGIQNANRVMGTDIAIDLTEYKTIEVEYTVHSMYQTTSPGGIYVRDSKDIYLPPVSAALNNTLGLGTTQLDISSLDAGSYYIWTMPGSNTSMKYTVHKIRLVK